MIAVLTEILNRSTLNRTLVMNWGHCEIIRMEMPPKTTISPRRIMFWEDWLANNLLLDNAFIL